MRAWASRICSCKRSVDMMYQGQWRALSVSVGAEITSIAALVRSFHEQHEREYNFRRDDAPVTLFRLNLKAIGVVPKVELQSSEPGGAMPAPVQPPPGLFSAAATLTTRPSIGGRTFRRGLCSPGRPSSTSSTQQRFCRRATP